MTSRVHLAHHLRRLRGDRSQAVIAAASGVDQTTISHLERGRRDVTLDTLDQIAGALEVEPHTLIMAAVAAKETT